MFAFCDKPQFLASDSKNDHVTWNVTFDLNNTSDYASPYDIRNAHFGIIESILIKEQSKNLTKGPCDLDIGPR